MKLAIDPVHSTAEFSVKHFMISTVKGRFQQLSGTIEFDEKNLANSSVEATIQTASISTDNEQRDGHLRSAEFLDVEKFPTLEFKSTKVEADGEGEYKVTGNLSLHGITKEVVLNVEYSGQAKSPFGDTRAGFSAKTSLSRKDYGIVWNAPLETGGVALGDKININLEIEAIVQVPATV
jgi:polyisoprenoid-binding protein YceI